MLRSQSPILRFHAPGNWGPQQVSVTRVSGSGRRSLPEIETLIESAWRAALARPGVKLFDGAMCRLESWKALPQSLQLTLSQTSYKPFLGTNLSHPDLAERYGRDFLANPVGVSPALITADGYLMMGRRNASVAYYPNRIHPFAGALDPQDLDPFAAVRRELGEELALTDEDIAPGGIRCTGIAEDLSIRQPELIFSARSTRTRDEIEHAMDEAEHHAAWSVRASTDGAEEALAQQLSGAENFTPVALAAILLWGRIEFGDHWFASRAPRLGR